MVPCVDGDLCVSVQIREGDYILRIAKHYFGVDVLAFILDNPGTIQLEDMSRPLPVGREVLVCGATTPPRALLGDGTNTTGELERAQLLRSGSHSYHSSTEVLQLLPDAMLGLTDQTVRLPGQCGPLVALSCWGLHAPSCSI